MHGNGRGRMVLFKVRWLLVLAAVVGVAACSGQGSGGGSDTTDGPDSTPDPYATLPAQAANSVEEFVLPQGTYQQPPGLKSTEFPAGTGYLRGPHFGLKLQWLASSEAIPAALGYSPLEKLAKGRKAAAGQELLLFAVDPQVRSGQWTRGRRTKPTAELVAGEHKLPLNLVPLRSTDGPTDIAFDGALVLASVPTNAPVKLRVTDEGRTQTLDVRTGDRTSDAIPGYYQPGSQKLDWTGSSPVGVTVYNGAYHYSSKFDVGLSTFTQPSEGPLALLAPWAPSHGWAPDGKRWLVVPAPRVDAELKKGNPLLTLTVTSPRAFVLRLPDGTELTGKGAPRTVKTTLGSIDDPGDITFQVPERFTKGTYVIDLGRSSVLAEWKDGKLPARWAPAPRQLTIPIKVS